LRERPADIGYLARGMAGRFTTRFKKDLFDVSPAALAALQSYPWPGNIRQLENCLQQAVLVSTGAELLEQHLPTQVREHGPVKPLRPSNSGDTLRDNREATERSVIERALASHGNSRSRAASALGISRVTLYKKMKKYGLMD
jgi:transcriptional regulator with PAS, ATPase and Fis domain